jgi:acyl-CoA reductase-like NAD-dependent aldehyde dehydrogenase
MWEHSAWPITDLVRLIPGWTDKIEGQTFPLEDGAFRMTQYEPYGVCAGIGPWNVSILYAHLYSLLSGLRKQR